jgi:hypothetical protein
VTFAPRVATDSQSSIPLPDFHLNTDKPDAIFAKLKDHFDIVTNPAALSSGAAAFPSPVVAEYVRQIHHGIYEVRGYIYSAGSGRNGDGRVEVNFAFKTECRPESKWHGQQGYPEILTNWAVETMFGADFIGSFTPGAVGGLVRVTKGELADKIHKDGCGFLTDQQVSALYKTQKSSALLSPPLADGERILIGAVLQWKASHNDDAIPGSVILRPFRQLLERGSKRLQLPKLPLPSLSGKSGVTIADMLQISDIFVLDYVLGNEDRLDKNWFKDEHRRFIAMDNGWALAGFNYDGSVCDVDDENLKCPPLFRKFSGKGCRGRIGGQHAEVVNCRFRKSTLDGVRRLIAVLESGISRSQQHDEQQNPNSLESLFRRDPLLSFLARFYGKIELRNTRKNDKGNKTKRPWSDALARYVAGCPKATAELAAAEKELSVSDLAAMVSAGLLARARQLLLHAGSCAERYGEAAVIFS